MSTEVDVKTINLKIAKKGGVYPILEQSIKENCKSNDLLEFFMVLNRLQTYYIESNEEILVDFPKKYDELFDIVKNNDSSVTREYFDSLCDKYITEVCANGFVNNVYIAHNKNQELNWAETSNDRKIKSNKTFMFGKIKGLIRDKFGREELSDKDATKQLCEDIFNLFILNNANIELDEKYNIIKDELIQIWNERNKEFIHIKDITLLFRQWGILPTYDNITHNCELKAIIAEPVRRFKSWLECNSEANKNYDTEREKCTKYMDVMDSDLTVEFSKMVTELGNPFGANDKNIYKYFNQKFLLFFKQVVQPKFVNGEPLDESNGSYSGEIKINSAGKVENYSIAVSVIDTIKKYPTIWSDRSWGESVISTVAKIDPQYGIDDITDDMQVSPFYLFYGYFTAYNYIQQHKRNAKYTPISKDSLPSLYLGNNYIPFKIDCENVDDDRFYITIKNMNNLKLNVLYRKPKLKFAKTKEKTKRNKCYFDNLKITNTNNNFKFEYNINGDPNRSVVAYLKEPVIRYNNRKDYFYLSATISKDVETDSELTSACWSKISNDTARRVNAEQYFNDNGVNIVGIDLGMNPIIAYSVLHYKNNEFIDLNITGKIADKDKHPNLNYKRMYEKRSEIKKLKTLIKMIPDYVNSDSNIFEGDNNVFKQLDKKSKGRFRSSEYMGYYDKLNVDGKFISELEIVKKVVNTKHYKNDTEKNNDIMRVYKGNKKNIIKKEIDTHRHQIHSIKDMNRRSDESNLCYVYDMVSYIDDFKKLVTSYNKIGEDYNNPIKPLSDPMLFSKSKLYEYRQNIRDNFLKDICYQMVKIAKQYNAVLVHEHFEQRKGGIDRVNNILMALFTPNDIIKKLKCVAKREGVLVFNTNKNHTSQYVYNKNTVGYRDSNNKHNLYYIEDETTRKLGVVDSDINASKNIAARPFNKPLYAIKVKNYDDGLFLSDYNNKYVLYKKDGDKYVAIGDTYRIDKKKIKQGSVTLYLHNGYYVDGEYKNNYIENIKKLVL